MELLDFITCLNSFRAYLATFDLFTLAAAMVSVAQNRQDRAQVEERRGIGMLVSLSQLSST